MRFGLSEGIIEKLTQVFETNPKVDKAFIFGSRAKGNYRPDSDIDIAVKGMDIKQDDILKMQVEMDEKGVGYKVDLLNYDSIKDKAIIEHIDRVGFELYIRWKQHILSEVGTLKRGKSKHRPRYAFHLYGGIYPFIQTGDIAEAPKYITTFKQTYSEAGLEQSKLWPKGTLCITIAANIAEIAILGIDACFPDSVIGFIPDKDKSDLSFVYYTLKYFKKELQQMGDGSVQDNINLGTFSQISFPFPPLIEQKTIAEILSSLDDKIDFLHRQNKTLEELAETLFRQWFVEEAEDSWQEKHLFDIADHVKENIIPNKYPEAIYQHYSLPAFDEGKYPRGELGSDILSNKYKVTPNSILVSKLNPRFPRIWEIYENSIPENSVCSTEFQVVKPKRLLYFGFIYYFLKSNEAKQELSNAAGGTSGSHQRVNPSDIFNLAFFMPSESLIEQFNGIVNTGFKKTSLNNLEIQTLTQLRDNLLPKLMSGEVRVSLD